jgi:hypothetical protein
MTIRFTWRLMSVAMVTLVAFGGGSPGEARHLVLRFNLEEMTETADRIFLGRCVGAKQTEEAIAGGRLPVTVYSFEVERVVKGRVPRRLTFRQLGHPSGRALGKGGEITSNGRTVTPAASLHGMAGFREGDRLVLFLSPDHMGGRLTYPVGLAQGAFSVSTPDGRELVRNGLDNRGLLTAPYTGYTVRAHDARVVFPDRGEPLDASFGSAAKALARSQGALPLKTFLELVDRINAARGGAKGEVVR